MPPFAISQISQGSKCFSPAYTPCVVVVVVVVVVAMFKWPLDRDNSQREAFKMFTGWQISTFCC
jgi:hypothetical protein